MPKAHWCMCVEWREAQLNGAHRRVTVAQIAENFNAVCESGFYCKQCCQNYLQWVYTLLSARQMTSWLGMQISQILTHSSICGVWRTNYFDPCRLHLKKSTGNLQRWSPSQSGTYTNLGRQLMLWLGVSNLPIHCDQLVTETITCKKK